MTRTKACWTKKAPGKPLNPTAARKASRKAPVPAPRAPPLKKRRYKSGSECFLTLMI